MRTTLGSFPAGSLLLERLLPLHVQQSQCFLLSEVEELDQAEALTHLPGGSVMGHRDNGITKSASEQEAC